MRWLRLFLGLAFLQSVLGSTAVMGQRGLAGVVHKQERARERAQRWAVLIGVNKYEDEQGIGSLKYCVPDMKLLRQVLTGPRGGFHPDNVLLMTDDAADRLHRPTYPNMVTMIPRWLEDVGPKDGVLIAFAGHGMEENGKCYLLPCDAKRGALQLTSVSVPQIREWLEACRAERKILVLDACHSGAGRAPGQMSERMKEELETGHGFVRLASCDTKQKSSEDDTLGHGVFTYHFVQGLQGKGDLDGDGRVDADEAYRYVSREVGRWAREHGVDQDPLWSGRKSGPFTLTYAGQRVARKEERKQDTPLADLLIRLDPADAAVKVDGQPVPVRERGRLAFTRVEPGRHELEVGKAGYARVEKVIDVPATGAEGTVQLSPVVTHVTVYRGAAPKVVGELLSQAGDKITVKIVRGTATFRMTYRKEQYTKIEKREVPVGESFVQIRGKTPMVDEEPAVAAAMPQGDIDEQVKLFQERWAANEKQLQEAVKEFGKASPEVRQIEQQKQALQAQAVGLARKVSGEIQRAEQFRQNLLAQGRGHDSLVVQAAAREVAGKQSLLSELWEALPDNLRETNVIKGAALRWEQVYGKWTFENGTARVVEQISPAPAGEVGQLALGGVDAADYVFRVRLIPQGRYYKDYGIVFRAVDRNNFYYLGLYHRALIVNIDGRGLQAPGHIIARMPDGVDISQALLEVRLIGSDIRILADGRQIMQVTDSTFTHGRVGLRTYTKDDGGYSDYVQILSSFDGRGSSLPLRKDHTTDPKPAKAAQSEIVPAEKQGGTRMAEAVATWMGTVPGNVRWTETGLDVQPGDTLRFSATGRVRPGPKDDRTWGRPVGPSGMDIRPGFIPVSGARHTCLIGRIGANGKLFAIGASKQVTVREETGRLWLSVNDENVNDNSGAFRVTVRLVARTLRGRRERSGATQSQTGNGRLVKPVDE